MVVVVVVPVLVLVVLELVVAVAVAVPLVVVLVLVVAVVVAAAAAAAAAVVVVVPLVLGPSGAPIQALTPTPILTAPPRDAPAPPPMDKMTCARAPHWHVTFSVEPSGKDNGLTSQGRPHAGNSPKSGRHSRRFAVIQQCCIPQS